MDGDTSNGAQTTLTYTTATWVTVQVVTVTRVAARTSVTLNIR